MASTSDFASALSIIESWGWDYADPRFEFHVPVMVSISDAINRLAMDGHHDPAGAVLALLAEGKIEATGHFRWKKYYNGHFEREGTGAIPARRWKDLLEGCESNHPTKQNLTELHLIGDEWNESKAPRADWDWNNDRFSTAEVSSGDWLDQDYFEEAYSASDIEVRPASFEGGSIVSDGSGSNAIERNRGGAPMKYDWEQAVAAIVFRWADDGPWQPGSQADVKRCLADWFADRDEHPSESALKERARWLFKEFERRSEGGDNLAA